MDDDRIHVRRLLTAAWAKLAADEELFQYPTSTADTLAGVLDDLGMGFTVEENRLISAWEKEKHGVVQKWIVTTGDGKRAHVSRAANGDIWVDAASLRTTESRGTALYAGLLNYAYNSFGRLVGDPNGVSDMAIFRRTENMLASALKFGSTEHMLPAKEQSRPGLYIGLEGHDRGVTEKFRPLDWTDNPQENLANLLEVSHAHVCAFVPEVKNAYYNFETETFHWADSHRRIEEGDFRRLARALHVALRGDGRLGSEDAGREDRNAPERTRLLPRGATLQRTIITHTLLRAARSQDRGRSELAAIGSKLRGGVGRQGQRPAETDSDLPGILYSYNRPAESDAEAGQLVTPASRPLDFGARSVEELAREYAAMDATDGGRVIDVDRIRELSPEYRADRSRAHEIHAAASRLSQQLFERALAQPVGEGRDTLVVFTAGGSGSGKSTAITRLLGDGNADITLDGTFSTLHKARVRVRAALDSGRDVEIRYVYRAPENAAQTAIRRAISTGRAMLTSVLAENHAESLKTVRAIAEEFKGDKRVSVVAIYNNTNSQDDAHITDLQQIPEVYYDSAKRTFDAAVESAWQRAVDADTETALHARVQPAGEQTSQDGDIDAGRRGADASAARLARATIPGSTQSGRARGDRDTVGARLTPALYEAFMGRKPPPAADFKLSEEMRRAQMELDFDSPLPATPASADDQAAADVLNRTLARKFDNPAWLHAYQATALPDELAGLRNEFQAAFGRTIRPVLPTDERFNCYGGVYLPDRPGEVYVNVRQPVNFLQLAGHEMLHDLKREREDLYNWFIEQADRYLVNVAGYQERLNRLAAANGNATHTLQSAKEELIADFCGDALADKQFCGQLAESDSDRFTGLLHRVTAWLDKLGDKLRGLDSSQHVKDVDGLREHLKDVLVAYATDKTLEEVQADEQAQTPKAPQQGSGHIEDFGEKLGRARKDMAQSLAKTYSDDDIARLPLSKIWPKEEVDAIEDTHLAAIAHTLRSQIPAKPRSSPRMVSRWAEKVQEMRRIAREVLSGELPVGEFREGLRESKTLRPLLEKIDLLEQLDRAHWRHISEVANGRDVHYVGGYLIGKDELAVEVDGKLRRFDISGHSAADRSYLADVAEKLNGTLAAKKDAKNDAPRFEVVVLQNSQSNELWAHKKGDGQHRALKTWKIPDNETGQTFANREVFPWIHSDEGQAELRAAWEDVKTRDNVKKEDVRGAENRLREGKDWRGGQDVTPEMFSQAFGFRGVEFGNWVKQGNADRERQWMLNEAYDALHDLADVLDIPSQAISLNGSLGIGFGSRGRGGRAAAHFEPDLVVINLTKTQGAGSLAHEWFHALDNYFSRMRGERHEHGYVTDNPYPVLMMVSKSEPTRKLTRERLEELRRLNPDLERFRPENWEPDPNHPVGVRVEMERAFAGLVRALNDSPMAERAQLADKGKKPYWSQTIERAARSFENYVIHKLDEQGRYNDYLANVVPPEVFARAADRYPYLKPDELAPVAEAFDNLFATVETRETDKGVALFSQQPKEEPEQLVSKAQPDEECARILQGEAVASVTKRDAVQVDGKSELADELRKMFADRFEGRANNSVLGTVLLDDQAAKDSAAHSDIHNEYKMATFAAAKDVIEHGGVIAHALHDGIHSYYIAAPVLIDGVRHVMTAQVRRTKEQRLYLHSIRLEANLLQQETKENLLAAGMSRAAAVGYATGDTGSQAPRGTRNLPEGIHAGKLKHSELTTRLHHLLTLDVPQQTQSAADAADDGIRYSLNALHEPTGASMNTDNTERTIALPSAADELLPELSRDVIAAQPFEQVWPENVIDRIEDNTRAALIWMMRDKVARPPNGVDWAERIYHQRAWARRALTVHDPVQELHSLHDGSAYGDINRHDYAHASLLVHLPRDTWRRITDVEQTYTGIKLNLDGQALHLTADVRHGRNFEAAAAQLRPLLNGEFVKADNIEYRKPYHEIVSEQLAESLRARQAPWQQSGARLPINPATGKRYKGANTLHLMMQGRSDPRWLTHAQARAMGAQVRENERGVTIQYWRYTDDQGNKLERPQSYYATVFNAEQMDGLPPLQEAQPRTRAPSEHASAIITASSAKIQHTPGNHTGYGVRDDTIYTPDPATFDSSDRYYAAALRGLTWWAGHPSRLNLDIAHPPGSQEYAKGALRSEIATMLLGEDTGIRPDPAQHTTHIEQWIELIERDPLAINRLAAEAEQIRSLVIGLENQREQTQGQAAAQEQAHAEQSAQQQQAPLRDERIYLEDVTYEEQELAASLGARYDRQEGAWYIPEDAPESVVEELTARWPERTDQQILPGNVPEQAQTPEQTQAQAQTPAQPAQSTTATAQPTTQQAQPSADPAAAIARMRAVADGQPLDTAAQNTERQRRRDLRDFTERVGRKSIAYVANDRTALGKRIGRADFRDYGDRIGVRNWKDDAVILAALQLGAEKWGSVRLTGSKRFQEIATAIAQANGIEVVNPATITYDGIHAGQAQPQAGQRHTGQPQPTAQPEAPYAQQTTTAQQAQAADTPQPAAPSAQQQPEQAAPQPTTQQATDIEREPAHAEQPQPTAQPATQAVQQQPEQAAPQPTTQQATDIEREPAHAEQENNMATLTSTTRKFAAAKATAAARQENRRVFLAVPYHPDEERKQVKALGARYDPAVKCWYYTIAGTTPENRQRLDAWLPGNARAAKQAPARDPYEEFGATLRAAGFRLEGNPVLDGKWHRVATADDDRGQKTGAYRGDMNGTPFLYWKDHRTGEEGTVIAKGYGDLSPAQRALAAQTAADNAARRIQETSEQHQARAIELAEKLKTYTPATQQTGYQAAKGIAPTPGSYTDKTGEVTILPSVDIDGKQWTTQYIQADGSKKFAANARKTGTFHPVTGFDSIEQAPVVIIAEGYATAATIAANTRPIEGQGSPAVLAAWDAGNLVHVAQAVRNKYPDKPIVIAGDDDLAQQNKSGKNPGRERAEEAARAVDGKAVFPTFASGEQQADPKHRSDFNDLAQNSSLGNQGVARQINAAVRQVVERQEQQVQQQQAQQQAQQAQQQDVHQQHVQQAQQQRGRGRGR